MDQLVRRCAVWHGSCGHILLHARPALERVWHWHQADRHRHLCLLLQQSGRVLGQSSQPQRYCGDGTFAEPRGRQCTGQLNCLRASRNQDAHVRAPPQNMMIGSTVADSTPAASWNIATMTLHLTPRSTISIRLVEPNFRRPAGWTNSRSTSISPTAMRVQGSGTRSGNCLVSPA